MTIRILLGVSSPWREALRAAADRAADVQVVGTSDAPFDTLLKVGKLRADVVVVEAAATGEPPGVVTHLLAEYPGVTVLSVTGDRATLYLWRLAEVPVADLSPAGLLDAVRTATGG